VAGYGLADDGVETQQAAGDAVAGGRLRLSRRRCGDPAGGR